MNPKRLSLALKRYAINGRALAQAVTRRLPTAVVRVRAHVRLCGICGGQNGTGAGFLRVLRFPLPIFIPPTAPHSSSIIRGRYSRPVSGRCTKWTQSHPTPRHLVIKRLMIYFISPSINKSLIFENHHDMEWTQLWKSVRAQFICLGRHVRLFN
jgi:hypothetical protein